MSFPTSSSASSGCCLRGWVYALTKSIRFSSSVEPKSNGVFGKKDKNLPSKNSDEQASRKVSLVVKFSSVSMYNPYRFHVDPYVWPLIVDIDRHIYSHMKSCQIYFGKWMIPIDAFLLIYLDVMRFGQESYWQIKYRHLNVLPPLLIQTNSSSVSSFQIMAPVVITNWKLSMYMLRKNRKLWRTPEKFDTTLAMLSQIDEACISCLIGLFRKPMTSISSKKQANVHRRLDRDT